MTPLQESPLQVQERPQQQPDTTEPNITTTVFTSEERKQGARDLLRKIASRFGRGNKTQPEDELPYVKAQRAADEARQAERDALRRQAEAEKVQASFTKAQNTEDNARAVTDDLVEKTDKLVDMTTNLHKDAIADADQSYNAFTTESHMVVDTAQSLTEATDASINAMDAQAAASSAESQANILRRGQEAAANLVEQRLRIEKDAQARLEAREQATQKIDTVALEAQREYDIKRNERTAAENEFKRVNEEATAAEAAVESLRQQLDTAIADLRGLEQDVKEESKQAEKINAIVAEAKKVERLEYQAVEQAKAAVAAIERAAADVEVERQNLVTEAASAEERANEKREKAEKEADNLSRASDEAKIASFKIGRLDRRLQPAEKVVSDLKQDEAEAEAMKQSVSELRKAEVQEILDNEIGPDLTKAEKEVADLKAAKTPLENHIQEARLLEVAAKATAREAKQAEKTQEHLKALVSKKDKAHKDINRKLETLKEVEAEVVAAHRAAETEVNLTEQSAKELNIRVTDLEARLSQQHQLIDQLRKQNAEAEANFDSKDAAYQVSTQQLDSAVAIEGNAQKLLDRIRLASKWERKAGTIEAAAYEGIKQATNEAYHVENRIQPVAEQSKQEAINLRAQADQAIQEAKATQEPLDNQFNTIDVSRTKVDDASMRELATQEIIDDSDEVLRRADQKLESAVTNEASTVEIRAAQESQYASAVVSAEKARNTADFTQEQAEELRKQYDKVVDDAIIAAFKMKSIESKLDKAADIEDELKKDLKNAHELSNKIHNKEKYAALVNDVHQELESMSQAVGGLRRKKDELQKNVDLAAQPGIIKNTLRRIFSWR